MRRFGRIGAAALLISYVLSVPAFAQQGADQQKKKLRDPNEVVCEKQEELGSRLSSTKICKTRAEWAEERRLQRMDVDKMQTQRGSCDGCQ